MGKTPDYDSCAKWMSLAVWAGRVYYTWNANTFYPRTDEKYRELFHVIATEALNRGFSLRAGNRALALVDLLHAISYSAEEKDELVAAFYRNDKESWLTKPGERKQAHV